jgi:hypothetical protein
LFELSLVKNLRNLDKTLIFNFEKIILFLKNDFARGFSGFTKFLKFYINLLVNQIIIILGKYIRRNDSFMIYFVNFKIKTKHLAFFCQTDYNFG